jgi:hypothetical protein
MSTRPIRHRPGQSSGRSPVRQVTASDDLVDEVGASSTSALGIWSSSSGSIMLPRSGAALGAPRVRPLVTCIGPGERAGGDVVGTGVGQPGAHCLLVELVVGDELRARRRSIPSSLTSESVNSQQ